MDIKLNLSITNPWWSNQKINNQFLLGRKRKESEDIIV